MFDLTPNQLPLQPFSQDDRPLPEIIAEGNPDPETGWPAFSLAWHDVEGVRYYAIQDWLHGVAQTPEPRKFWDALKRRTKKLKIELSTRRRQLPYRASNGKTYQVDYEEAEGLYRITQLMGVNTGLSQRILAFLAASGVTVDGQRIAAIQAAAEIDEPLVIDPEKMFEAVINEYKRRGKSDQWITARLQSIDQRKRFTEAFQQALRVKPSGFQFADITDTMRIGLWKRDSRQLRKEMGLGPKANVRDHGTDIMLIYEMLAERVSEFDLRKAEDLEYDQAKEIVHSDAEFVGKQATVTSKRLGIDLTTGKPLLGAGRK